MLEFSFEFWYLFPLAIMIATVAMSSGIGGQLEPRLQKIVAEDKMKVSISVVFVLIGIFMLVTLI